MRLFVAIDIPKDVVVYLKSVQSTLDKGYASMKLSDEFHLTLKFLGEIGDSEVSDVIKNLEGVNQDRFCIELDSFGAFQDTSNARIIWAGIKNSHELISLHSKIEDSLEGFGIKETHAFSPHITLARVSFIRSAEKLSEIISNYALEKKGLDVNSFSLYQSTLTQKGPIYKKIKEFRCL